MSGYDLGFDGRHRLQPADVGFDPLAGDSGYQPGDQNVFGAGAIVVDPHVPQAMQAELRRRQAVQNIRLRADWPAQRSRARHGRLSTSGGAALDPDELFSFRDPRPEVPRPPRSQETARLLTGAAAVLVVASIVVGVLVGPAAFAVPFVLGLAAAALAVAASSAARRGEPAMAGGLIPLSPASDLTEYQVMYAARICHRQYVRPQPDLDLDTVATWQRAVDAANRIAGSQVVKEDLIDGVQVGVHLPEWLWHVAKRLALLSEARGAQRATFQGFSPDDPDIVAMAAPYIRAQESIAQDAEQRVVALEKFADGVGRADDATRKLALLPKLAELNWLHADMMTLLGPDVDADLMQRLSGDAQFVIRQARQAIEEANDAAASLLAI
jgi:hypothetical protein